MTGLVSVELADKIRGELESALEPQLVAKRKLYDDCATLAASMRVVDAASLKLADDFAKDLLRERDELEEVRKSGPGALDRIVRALNAKFKPLRDVLDSAVANLKKERGDYLVAQKRQQTESFEAAAAAHMAGEHASAQIALEVAASAQTQAPAGTSVREVWVVKRMSPELMVLSTPDVPGLVPDEAAIAAYARKFPAGERPVVAGVVFDLVPQVTDRRA